MKRRRARHTTVSLDKPRLSSPIFPSITHSHWTPFFTAHSPTHPTRWRGQFNTWHRLCTTFLLIIIFACMVSIAFMLHSFSVLLLFFWCLLSSVSLKSSPSFSFAPLHLIPLSSQQLLLCQNGAKFNTSVDGKEKAVLAHLPHSFFFFAKYD